MPNYPTSSPSFTTKNTADTIQAAHVNDLQDEVVAIGSDLVDGNLRHDLTPSTTSTRALGSATRRWRLIHGTSGAFDRLESTSLSVAGNSTINALTVSSALTLSGGWNSSNSTITGGLNVTGGSTLTTLQATNSTLSNLSVSSNSTIVGGLTVSGGSTLATLNVTGGSTLTTLQATNSTVSNLSVSSNSTIAGGLTVTGGSTLGTLQVTGNTTLVGSVNAGNSTLNALSVQGGSTLTRLTLSSAAPAAPDTNSVYANTVVKAWASVNSAGTLLAQVNVSSAAKVSSGVYDLAFATALASSNYAAAVTANGGNQNAYVSGKASTGFRVNTTVDTDNPTDAAFSMIAVGG